MVASPAIWTGIFLLFKDILEEDLDYFWHIDSVPVPGAKGAAAFYPPKAAPKYDFVDMEKC